MVKALRSPSAKASVLRFRGLGSRPCKARLRRASIIAALSAPCGLKLLAVKKRESAHSRPRCCDGPAEAGGLRFSLLCSRPDMLNKLYSPARTAESAQARALAVHALRLKGRGFRMYGLGLRIICFKFAVRTTPYQKDQRMLPRFVSQDLRNSRPGVHFFKSSC